MSSKAVRVSFYLSPAGARNLRAVLERTQVPWHLDGYGVVVAAIDDGRREESANRAIRSCIRALSQAERSVARKREEG